MIPREILKKIRQIEIRTNRIVTQTAAEGLFYAASQLGWISRNVPNCADYDLTSCVLDCKVNGVGLGLRHRSFSSQTADKTKPFGPFTNFSEKAKDITGESLTQPRHSIIIEVNGLHKFPLGLLFDDNPKGHRLPRKRLSISATTSSSGRQFSVCANAYSARRSSSAISSGVSSSSDSSLNCSRTRRCSCRGSFRNCSTISVALMCSNLPLIDPFASS